MTDPDYTALLLVIDRSGSMQTIRDDMVGGLTTLLRTQAVESGRMTVDIVRFDDEVEHTHTMADPASVEIELEPRGMTALHDALGGSIVRFGEQLAAMDEAERPGTVVVVVATDGLENSSHEYTGEAVRNLVTQQQEQYDWDFVFLGANHDAVTAGTELGIRPESSIQFDADSDGAREVNFAASAYISSRKSRTAFSAPVGFTDEDRRRAKK